MTENSAMRLKKIMKIKNIKQIDILNSAQPYCKMYGVKLNKSDLSQYLSNKAIPGQKKLKILSLALNVSPAWLMGFDVPMCESENSSLDEVLNSNYENVIPMPKTKKIPLLGTIACGEPILAQENIDCDVDVPEHINADFALRCKGNSMIDANICDGDIVYIKQQPTVNNGEIAAVLIGDEATLKRFYQKKDTVTLMPCNTELNPLIYTGRELEEIRILGKAVYYLSRVK